MTTDNAKSAQPLEYTQSGVDTVKEEHVLDKRMLKWIKRTFAFRQDGFGSAKLDIGLFANVIDIGHGMGMALTTDGVGTKLLIAQMMDKYDTIGIDCVAMNVNDLICVGAEPISMLDYLAVQSIDHDEMLEAIAKGLFEGARISNITIPGGEIAQTRDMISGVRDGYGFDLVGMAMGRVSLNSMIVGQSVKEGDAVIGLRSSGIHSNGLTLARQTFFRKMGIPVDHHFPELGRTIGEELLEPTHIYVPEILEILNAKAQVKALINITSDGLLNLTRVLSRVGYIIETLPEPHPIFKLIQENGEITDEEMFKVFNMGIGFCIVVEENDVKKVESILEGFDVEHYRIGYAVRDEEEKVLVKPYNLVGKDGHFHKSETSIR